jgi:hypothetical protein
MSSAPTKDRFERRELAFRRSEGIDVSLIWISPVESLAVLVRDTRSGSCFELVVERGTEAIDVFRHPFAYAAWRGVDYDLPGELRAA